MNAISFNFFQNPQLDSLCFSFDAFLHSFFCVIYHTKRHSSLFPLFPTILSLLFNVISPIRTCPAIFARFVWTERAIFFHFYESSSHFHHFWLLLLIPHSHKDFSFFFIQFPLFKYIKNSQERRKVEKSQNEADKKKTNAHIP